MSLAEYDYTYTTKAADIPWLATEYKILWDGVSGTGTFSADNSQSSITYMCEYEYLNQFLDVVMGKTVKISGGLSRSNTEGGSFGPSHGSLPEPHPTISNFRAISASVYPKGTVTVSNPPEWNKAVVSVVFRPLTYLVIPDAEEPEPGSEVARFTTKVPEFGSEFQTSLGFFKFVGTGRQLDTTPGQTIPFAKYTYTWLQIPVEFDSGLPVLSRPPNADVISGMMGTINSQDFDEFRAGSLLMQGASARLVLPQTATSNAYYWDISYIFGHRDYGESPYFSGTAVGWNYAYDPLQGTWDLFTDNGDSTGQPLYPAQNFVNLFTVSW